MNPARLLDNLDAEAARLRDLAATGRGPRVPEIARALAEIYLYQVSWLRDGAEPDPWPPAGLLDGPEPGLLGRAHEQLRAEFTARRPDDPAGTGIDPDRTVRACIRHMTHATVVCRIDAEIAADLPVTRVPDDLAIDGVDWLLRVVLAGRVAAEPEYFRSDPRTWTHAIRAGDAAWHVRTGPGLCLLDADPGPGADLTVSGPPGRCCGGCTPAITPPRRASRRPRPRATGRRPARCRASSGWRLA